MGFIIFNYYGAILYIKNNQLNKKVINITLEKNNSGNDILGEKTTVGSN